ncbi:MAG: hypothetical protein AABZ47_13040 [Planctomycetota bacterium]
MLHQWQVESASGRCAITGRVLEPGEWFFTALFEEGESFRRADYCQEGWSGPPEGCFCHFKTRVPIREQRKKTFVDSEMLIGFFTRLADETELLRRQFRFVLALILMRKRVLRYDGSTTTPDGDVWKMTFPRDGSTHEVINPRLTEDQIEGVSRQLSAVLHGDMGQWTDPVEPNLPLPEAEN